MRQVSSRKTTFSLLERAGFAPSCPTICAGSCLPSSTCARHQLPADGLLSNRSDYLAARWFSCFLTNLPFGSTSKPHSFPFVFTTTSYRHLPSLSSSLSTRTTCPPADFSVIVFCTGAGRLFGLTGSAI